MAEDEDEEDEDDVDARDGNISKEIKTAMGSNYLPAADCKEWNRFAELYSLDNDRFLRFVDVVVEL